MYNNLRASQKGLRGDQWACVANGVISAGLEGKHPVAADSHLFLWSGKEARTPQGKQIRRRGQPA